MYCDGKHCRTQGSKEEKKMLVLSVNFPKLLPFKISEHCVLEVCLQNSKKAQLKVENIV